MSMAASNSLPFPLPWEELHGTVFLGPPSQTGQDLDPFSHFCRAQANDRLTARRIDHNSAQDRSSRFDVVI